MSHITVPWTPREPIRYGPFARLFVQLGGLGYRIFAPILRRFPAPVFFGSVVVVILLIWAIFLACDFVDTSLVGSTFDTVETGAFGAQLTLDEISRALAADENGKMPPGGPGVFDTVGAAVLYVLQFSLVRDILGILALVGFISVVPMFSIWWERKVAARIQSRMGPMRVGGWHGWIQSLADGVKLMSKEDLCPADSDRVLFRLAPYLAFVPAVLAFVALPFATYWWFRNIDAALIFILAMLGIEVYGVIVSGWASNNKWAIYGAMREACQIVSYEIPMGFSLLLPIMSVGTLNLITLGDSQAGGWHTWLAFHNPFIFCGFLVFYIASLASCKRAPFDLPESESELVAGFHTEYSGFRWSLFFFAEYAAMFVMSAVAVILFLGAWYSPLPEAWGDALVVKLGLTPGSALGRGVKGILFSGPLWFVAKSTFLIYVQMWIRWTLPRIRIDQVLYSCVQVMLPFAFLLLLGHTVWEIYVAGSAFDWAINVLLSLVGAVLAIGFIVIALYGWLNRRRLVGRLAVDMLPGS